jgi:hypothetical protein
MIATASPAKPQLVTVELAAAPQRVALAHLRDSLSATVATCDKRRDDFGRGQPLAAVVPQSIPLVRHRAVPDPEPNSRFHHLTVSHVVQVRWLTTSNVSMCVCMLRPNLKCKAKDQIASDRVAGACAPHMGGLRRSRDGTDDTTWDKPPAPHHTNSVERRPS